MTNAASEGPSLRRSLLLKDGLHVQSEDQRVFVYADPALLSQHVFVVFLGSGIGEIDTGSAIRVLNDCRHTPSSLRREANDGRQRELARGLKNSLANVAKCQNLNAWYQSLTSSFVFLAKELERPLSGTFRAAAWHRNARLTIEETCRASRYVLSL